MQIFEMSSLPIDQAGDLDRMEERLGDFFFNHETNSRIMADSTHFPMREPIGALRERIGPLEGLYQRARPFYKALEAWALSGDEADLRRARHHLGPPEREELAARLGSLAALAGETDDPAAWRQLLDALDLQFWRVAWARGAIEMYQTMEQQVLRAVRYLLITWEPDNVSELSLRLPLAAATRRPVRRVSHLPPIIGCAYRERLSHLEPEEPGHPYLAVLTSYDCVGEWDATLFHDLISLNMDLTIAADIVTLGRNKAQRVAEMAYNAAKLVARDPSLIDTRGEQVVRDAREVLAQLRGQTLHQIQIAILVRGRSRDELEANSVTVRDLFGPRLKLMRPDGAQGAALRIFSTTPRSRLDAPWKPRTQLSKAVGCVAGMIGFHRPNQTRGIFVGVDRNGRFPVFINLFERNQAAHMIIAGQSGHGKTVLLNLLAERAAAVGDMQVIGIDDFANGVRVERAIQDCTCYRVGLEHTVNPLDVAFGWESEGGWLNNQILHSIGQVAMLLGEPGESPDGKERYVPLRLQSSQRGVLSLAVKRLYQRYRVTPETPAEGTPGLTELILVLEEMDDPVARDFATRLRYLIYGSCHDMSDKTPEGLAFDGQSTIDFRFTSRIVYFDFKGVPELLRSLYYLNTMSKTWRYVSTRRLLWEIFLMVDEFGHASQNEAVARFAWVMAKTARKFRAGLVLVDQTMRPFLETASGRQLHANAAAHFFFHMQDSEAEHVGRAMSVITPRAQRFISNAEPGQCLGVIRKDIYEINVECHPLEADAFLNS